MIDDTATTEDHGREGSAAACQVLLLLHKHRPLGLSADDLSVFLGRARVDIKQALIGLRERARVAPVGRGTAARWVLQQDVQATSTAQPITAP